VKTSIAGVLTVFLMGVVIGAMLAGKFVELRVRDAIDGGPEETTRMIERRLAQKLALTPGQRQDLRPLLEDAQSRIRAIRRRSEPEIWQILEETRTEIRASLSPDQVRAYDAMVEDARRKWFPEARTGEH
jgi:hypothetical protein